MKKKKVKPDKTKKIKIMRGKVLTYKWLIGRVNDDLSCCDYDLDDEKQNPTSKRELYRLMGERIVLASLVKNLIKKRETVKKAIKRHREGNGT